MRECNLASAPLLKPKGNTSLMCCGIFCNIFMFIYCFTIKADVFRAVSPPVCMSASLHKMY